MKKEDIVQLLKNIYAETNLFQVTEVNVNDGIFVLTDQSKRNRFYKYHINELLDTITIYSVFDTFKRKRFISSYLERVG